MPKLTPQEQRIQEGFNPSRNSLKALSDSTFGDLALGPLNGDYFSDHEQEVQARSTGFHQPEDAGYLQVDDIESDYT